MKTEAKTSRWNLQKAVLALALGVTVAGAAAAPAMAADWRHDRDDRYQRHHHVYRPYVPPRVPAHVYAPPVYGGFSFPSFSFFFPFR